MGSQRRRSSRGVGVRGGAFRCAASLDTEAAFRQGHGWKGLSALGDVLNNFVRRSGCEVWKVAAP